MRIEVSDLLIRPNVKGQISDRHAPRCKGANAQLGTVYDHFVPEPYEK